jgi:sulfur carrier protein
VVKVKLNGKPAEVRERITLADLLKEMKIEPQRVACEVNQTIVRRKLYPETVLAEGDEIEILQMIGGG